VSNRQRTTRLSGGGEVPGAATLLRPPRPDAATTRTGSSGHSTPSVHGKEAQGAGWELVPVLKRDTDKWVSHGKPGAGSGRDRYIRAGCAPAHHAAQREADVSRRRPRPRTRKPAGVGCSRCPWTATARSRRTACIRRAVQQDWTRTRSSGHSPALHRSRGARRPCALYGLKLTRTEAGALLTVDPGYVLRPRAARSSDSCARDLRHDG